MPRIRITKSADQNKVAGSINGKRFCVPVDDNFHPIAKELLPALDDSDVQYEIEQPGPEKAPAGGADGLGGSAAPPTDPLDHDKDGKKGGSKKGAKSTRAKGAAKKKAAKKAK